MKVVNSKKYDWIPRGVQKSPFSPRWEKLKFYSLILTETYKRNDEINWFEVFKMIQKRFSLEITNRVWQDFCIQNGLAFELISGFERVGGYFDLNDRLIVIQITEDILDKIIIGSQDELQEIADNFYVAFTHEDTHRQQQSKSKIKINQKYKPSCSKYWNEALEQDFEYFNQSIEADAYGREIGARLEKRYKDPFSILVKINHNQIDDKYTKSIINVYKDPRVDKKVSHKFFRALYDYLNGDTPEEIKESKSKKYLDPWWLGYDIYED